MPIFCEPVERIADSGLYRRHVARINRLFESGIDNEVHAAPPRLNMELPEDE
jgi:hypothetical protein